MLPFLIAGGVTLAELLAGGAIVAGGLYWLISNKKDPKLEAKKRGINRAAKVYEIMLEDLKDEKERAKKYALSQKKIFEVLVDEKVEKIEKLEEDLKQYKLKYEEHLRDISKNREVIAKVSSDPSFKCGWGNVIINNLPVTPEVAIPPIMADPIAILKYIMEKEDELKKIEDEAFDNAKRMWESKIIKLELDEDFKILDAKVQDLIKVYEDCNRTIIKLNKEIFYYVDKGIVL